jgi:hypothetical protein
MRVAIALPITPRPMKPILFLYIVVLFPLLLYLCSDFLTQQNNSEKPLLFCSSCVKMANQGVAGACQWEYEVPGTLLPAITAL